MKTISFIFILLTCIAKTFTQTFTDTMYFDIAWEQSTKENAKYYRIITMDNSGDFLFHVTDYYLSGQVQMTGTYRSIRPDNREGKFTWYFSSGQKQQECTYKNNYLHGLFQEWYENGQLKSRQFFYEDILDGPVKTWDGKGKIQMDAQYSKGEKHGYFITYYDNGQMIRKDLYENDKLIEGQCYNRDGTSTEYFPYVVLPQYKGGPPELKKYIDKNLKYPKTAEKQGREGTVIVLFTVDESGQVKDPQIVHGDLDDFNEEALRLVNSFPPWLPGKIDNVPATLQRTISIDFRLR
jgi:TonB family protein